MLWEILLTLLAIIGLLWHKKTQRDKYTDYSIQRLPARLLNKDIENRVIRLQYFMAFRVEETKTTIFEVSEADYYKHTKGEAGTLVFQHHEFIRFEVTPAE